MMLKWQNSSSRFFFLVVFSAFFIFLSSPSKSCAGSMVAIDSDKQFDFAESYFKAGEYLKAIIEYERFNHFFPDDERVELALYRIGMSYFKSRQFKKAINAFTTLINRYGYTDLSILSIQSYLMISECHIGLNETVPAIINLHNLAVLTDDLNVKDEVYYRAGWIYLEKGSWGKARLYFEKISTPNKNKYQLKKLAVELDQEKYIAKKNPTAAGFLSIIPGAGHLYCERYQDALIAFLFNAGLIWAAYESFDNDHEVLGGVITFVEIGFYAGNIYGATTSAHKYNQTKTRQFIEKLKENTKVNLSAGYKSEGILLSLRYIF